MIWKGLGLICNTESPIVVVLSGSMEPAFYKGDLLFLTNPSSPIEAGEIVVYKIKGRDIPIVHRVMRVHHDNATDEQFILTKGDNNHEDDVGLYDQGQLWIKREDIIGRVKAFLPYVGEVTILLNSSPKVKAALLGGLALLVLTTRE